jgi:hypothetical protein
VINSGSQYSCVARRFEPAFLRNDLDLGAGRPLPIFFLHAHINIKFKALVPLLNLVKARLVLVKISLFLIVTN